MIRSGAARTCAARAPAGRSARRTFDCRRGLCPAPRARPRPLFFWRSRPRRTRAARRRSVPEARAGLFRRSTPRRRRDPSPWSIHGPGRGVAATPSPRNIHVPGRGVAATRPRTIRAAKVPARPNFERRRPFPMTFAALDCWRRSLEGHSKSKTNGQNLRAAKVPRARRRPSPRAATGPSRSRRSTRWPPARTRPRTPARRARGSWPPPRRRPSGARSTPAPRTRFVWAALVAATAAVARYRARRRSRARSPRLHRLGHPQTLPNSCLRAGAALDRCFGLCGGALQCVVRCYGLLRVSAYMTVSYGMEVM